MAEDVDRELAPIADQLYTMRPDDFAAARDEHVRAARAEGKQTLARELAKLRKPTLSAWLINLLWRDQHDVMEQLFELAGELGRAQSEASGPALRELTAQRRQLEGAMLRRAQALAEQAGANVTDSMLRDAQETLSAAMAQPEVADEVRSGRLVKPASYSGFGVMPGTAPPPRRAPTPAEKPPAEPLDLEAAKRARAEREAAERRQAAERRVQEARGALALATRELDEQARARDAAAERRKDLRAQLDELKDRVRRLETELVEVEREVDSAARAHTQAERAQAAAQQALDRAEATLPL